MTILVMFKRTWYLNMKSATFPTNQDHLTIGLPTPCNFYFGHRNRIAPSKFFGLLRHSDTPAQKEKTTNSGYQNFSRLWPEISGAETRPGSHFFSAGKFMSMWYWKPEGPQIWPKCVTNAESKSTGYCFEIDLKSWWTDLQIYRFPRHSTMIGHLYEHGRSSGALGGMWTGGVQRACMSE